MSTDASVHCEACGASIQAETSGQVLGICTTCGNQIILETGHLLPRNAVVLEGGELIMIPARSGNPLIVPVQQIKIFMELGLANKI